VFTTLQNAGGFTTQDHSFTYDPRGSAPNVTSSGADLKTDCTNAANNGTPCTISGATIDSDGSFRPVHVSSGYLGGNKVTLSDVRTHALTHPTVEESTKTANQYGIKATEKAKGGANVPFVAKGEVEVGSEQSFQRTNEDTTTHKGPVEVDTNQRGSTVEFTPGSNGAHLEERENTAKYTGGYTTVQGQDENGNPAPIEIDDDATYERTKNNTSNIVVDGTSGPSVQTSGQPESNDNNAPKPLPAGMLRRQRVGIPSKWPAGRRTTLGPVSPPPRGNTSSPAGTCMQT
jgi:hypothetical protein